MIFDNNILIEKYLNLVNKKHKQISYILKPILKIIHSYNRQSYPITQVTPNKKIIEPLPEIKNITSSNDSLLKIPKRKQENNEINKNNFDKNDDDTIKNSLINIALKKVKMKK